MNTLSPAKIAASTPHNERDHWGYTRDLTRILAAAAVPPKYWPDYVQLRAARDLIHHNRRRRNSV